MSKKCRENVVENSLNLVEYLFLESSHEKFTIHFLLQIKAQMKSNSRSN